jgi:hypothetical protein
MAWRNPRYAFLHAARTAGAAAISSQNAFAAAQPKELLVDDRYSERAKFNAAATDHHVQLDRGAGTLEAIDRLLVPAGHNFSGGNLRIRHADDSGFTTGVADLLASTAVSGSALLDYTLTSSTKRYVRMDWPSSPSTAWEWGEWILTRTRATTRGPEPGWKDAPRHAVQVFETPSAIDALLETGPDRREIEYLYHLVKDAADLAVFEELISAVGMARPLVIDPAYDSEGPLFVRLTQAIERAYDNPAPNTNPISKSYRLRFLEVLG